MDPHEEKIYSVLIIAALLLGTFICYFIISIVRHQRSIIELQKSQMRAEIAAMEKERDRIARDLHDELGPLLSVIKFRIDYVRDAAGKDQAQLEEASQQLDTILHRVREIASDLTPSLLPRKGLVAALKDHMAKVQSVNRLNISFEYPPVLELSADKAIHVYRAIQEIIHNCVRHAGASEQHILIEVENSWLRIRCRDNGKGFEYDKSQKKGLGLGNLKVRAEILGGKMYVESIPGKGTSYLFEIPV